MATPDSPRSSSSAAMASSLSSASDPLASPRPMPSVVGRSSRTSLQRQAQEHAAALAAAAAAAATAATSHPTDPPLPSLQSHARGDHGQAHLSEVAASEPTMLPVFALLGTTSHPTQRHSTYHASVHYIFADDDPDALTEALTDQEYYDNESTYLDDAAAAFADDRDFDAVMGHTRARRPVRVEERAVLVDMEACPDASGFTVSWAASLSPSWALVSAHVRPMQADEDGAETAGRADDAASSLVLKLEGVELDPATEAAVAGSPPATAADKLIRRRSGRGSMASLKTAVPTTPPPIVDYNALLQQFDQRMDVLRKVIDAGEMRRQKRVSKQDEAAVEGGDGGGGGATATTTIRTVSEAHPPPSHQEADPSRHQMENSGTQPDSGT